MRTFIRSRMSALGLLAILALAAPATAVNYSITTLVDPITDDGQCSLREALQNIFSQPADMSFGDCATASGGPDVITFAGGGSGTHNAANPYPDIISEVSISGAGQSVVIDGADSTNQAFQVESTGNLSLDQLTLQNFAASAVMLNNSTAVFSANIVTFDSNGASSGAAISGSAATVTITNSIFTSNTATGNGGAIAVVPDVSMTISGGLFGGPGVGNTADRGGAIYVSSLGAGRTITMTGVAFTDNTSNGTDSADGGGAIYIQASDAASVITIINGVFTLNEATGGRGGAIYNNLSGNVQYVTSTLPAGGGIFASDFSFNTAGGPAGLDGLGGAIYNQGNMTIANSVFDSNDSTNSGGGAIGHNGGGSQSLVISNTTFNGNTATTQGGAINSFNAAGTVTLYNSTIAGNTAAAASGGGIFLNGDADLRNTIIASNTGDNCAGTGTATDTVGNLQFGDMTCGLGVTADPMLAALTLNPGPIPVRTMEIQAGSAALGTGDSATCSSGPVVFLDARGWFRPSACDKGAYEADAARVVINEIDYDQGGAAQGATDDEEFIELYNAGSSAIDLDPFSIELVNGATGGAAVYTTIDLPSFSLGAGAYYVICNDAATVPNCDFDHPTNSNLIQNGAPDAVGLRASGVLMDAVSYEGDSGAPYTEGTGTAVADTNTDDYFGLSRTSDGVDTDDNSADFSAVCNSPGETNKATTVGCLLVPVELQEFTIE